jgi:hypothetical protein
MKKIINLSILVFTLFAQLVQASPLGGQIISDKKDMGSIYLECVNADEFPCLNAVIVSEINGAKTKHSHLIVPMGNEFDQYAERWGVFNELSTEASIRMPLFPEFRYLFLVNLSMKSYRDGFKVLEAPAKTDEPFRMRALFLEKLLQVISL